MLGPLRRIRVATLISTQIRVATLIGLYLSGQGQKPRTLIQFCVDGPKIKMKTKKGTNPNLHKGLTLIRVSTLVQPSPQDCRTIRVATFCHWNSRISEVEDSS